MSEFMESSPRSSRWDSARFMCLAKAHMAEHVRRYLRFGLALVALFWVVFVFAVMLSVRSGWDVGVQVFVFWAGLFITGYAFASVYFDGMSSRGAALLWLMRPASVLEKTVLCALVVAVLYPLAYTALFMVLNAPASELAFSLYHLNNPTPEIYSADMKRYWPFTLDAEHMGRWELACLLMVWGLQAWALAAVLWFRRFGVMLGLVVAFVVMLMTFVVGAYAKDAWDVLGVWWGGRHSYQGAVTWLFHVVNGVFWLGVPALLWGLVGINLRDKELLA